MEARDRDMKSPPTAICQEEFAMKIFHTSQGEQFFSL